MLNLDGGRRIFSIYMFSSFVNSTIGFITAIVLAKILLPEEYAYIGFFLMMLYILEPLLSFSSIGLIEINYVTLCKKDYYLFRDKYLSCILIFFVFCFFLSIVSTLLFPSLWFLVLSVPIISIIRSFTKVYIAELVQDKKAKTISLALTTTSILTFVFTIVLVSLFNLSWEGRLTAIFFSEIIILSILLRKGFIHGFTIFSSSEFLKLLAFGFPIYFGVGAAWLMHESDKIIIFNFFDLTSVGIYTFSYTIGKSIDIISVSYIKTIRPLFYLKMKKKTLNCRDIFQSSLVLAVVLFTVCVISLAVISNYGKYVLDDAYLSGINIIMYVMFAFSFFGIYRVSSLIFEYHKANYEKTKILYFSAAINIVSSLLLVNYYGVLGPAIGTLLGFIFLFFQSFRRVKYLLKHPSGFKNDIT